MAPGAVGGLGVCVVAIIAPGPPRLKNSACPPAPASITWRSPLPTCQPASRSTSPSWTPGWQGPCPTGPFSQCVLALPSPTHLGLTQHDVGSGRPFDPTSPGLDRLRLACASRGADQGAKHLDNLGISHNDVQDATYGSALSLAAPAGNALEFRLCVRPIPSRSVRVAARPEPECSGRVAGRHVG